MIIKKSYKLKNNNKISKTSQIMTVYICSSDSDEFSEDEYGNYINASPKVTSLSLKTIYNSESFNKDDRVKNIYKSNLLSKCFGGWVYFINLKINKSINNINKNNQIHWNKSNYDFNQKSFISLSLMFSQLIFYKKGINNWINFTKEQINKKQHYCYNNNFNNNSFDWINIKRLFNKLKYILKKRKTLSKNIINCSTYKKLAKYSIHILFSTVFKRTTRINSYDNINRLYILRLLRFNFNIWRHNRQKGEFFCSYI
jgi:hypothetical protein